MVVFAWIAIICHGKLLQVFFSFLSGSFAKIRMNDKTEAKYFGKSFFAERNILMAAVIDRTLSYMPLNTEFVQKNHIFSYLNALKECGTDYIEIGRSALSLLDSEDLSERCIFRVENEADLSYCEDRRFAYVSVPHSLSHLFRTLSRNQNILIELYADEYSAPAILLRLKSSGLLRYISVIRLTGFFSAEAQPMEKLIRWFHKEFAQSIDICPLNKAMIGCIGAIGAKEAGADAVTLSFGRDFRYTSLESYYIDSHILSRTYMPKEVIMGICRASSAYLEIFGSLPCGLNQLNELAERLNSPICNPERGILYRRVMVRGKETRTCRDDVRQKIQEKGLETELEESILAAVRKAGLLG